MTGDSAYGSIRALWRFFNKVKFYQMTTKWKQDTDGDGQSTKKEKHCLRKYNVTYLEYGFEPHTTDISRPFCLCVTLCCQIRL